MNAFWWLIGAAICVGIVLVVLYIILLIGGKHAG